MMCTFKGQVHVEIGITAMTLTYGMELLLSSIDHLGDTHPNHPPDFLAFLVIV